MDYNKASEENNWWKWKNSEEKKLRELGVEENVIESLRQFDWEVFKSERRYKEHRLLEEHLIEQKEAEKHEQDIYNIQQLFEAIENEQLLHILMGADKKTLQILLLKMIGLSIAEISSKTDIKIASVYKRINRLKKKLRKIL